MPDRRLTLAWGDLQLLGAVAAMRTLPAAAERLGVDHSTVFRRLRQIEATLHAAVFERTPQGYVPTAAGAELVALAGQTATRLDDALRRLSGQDPEPDGEVRVAVSDILLSDLMMPMLAAFQAQHCRVRLDLVTGNLPLNLSRRDADVAVRATASPPDTLVGRRVARIAWAPYASRAVCEAWGEPGPPPDAPWVGFGDALAGLAGAARLRAMVPERVVCRCDTVGGLKAAVLAGLGVGLLPCFAGEATPTLQRLSDPDQQLGADLWLLTHPDLRHAPRIRLLLDSLAAQLALKRTLIEGSV